MDARTEEAIPEFDPMDPDEQIAAELAPPGFQESVALALDSFLTLTHLFKAEAALAMSVLPTFVALNITRLPVYLLTWISFAILVAAAVYSLTANLLLTAGAFFLLHLALTLLLEGFLRKARETCSLPETRKSLAMTITTLKERFKDEQGHS
jgi:hypothetical protein